MNTTALNPSQLCLLETFSSIETREEAEDLSRVIRDYYAKKLDAELTKLWDNGTLDQKKLDKLRGQHLRTPYEKN